MLFDLILRSENVLRIIKHVDVNFESFYFIDEGIF